MPGSCRRVWLGSSAAGGEATALHLASQERHCVPMCPLMPCPWSQTCPSLLDYFQGFSARLASLCIHISSLYPNKLQTPEEDQPFSSSSPHVCPTSPPLAPPHLRNREVLIASCPHSMRPPTHTPTPPPRLLIVPTPSFLKHSFCLYARCKCEICRRKTSIGCPPAQGVSSFVQHDSFWSSWPICGSCGSSALPSSHSLGLSPILGIHWP